MEFPYTIFFFFLLLLFEGWRQGGWVWASFIGGVRGVGQALPLPSLPHLVHSLPSILVLGLNHFVHGLEEKQIKELGIIVAFSH